MYRTASVLRDAAAKPSAARAAIADAVPSLNRCRTATARNRPTPRLARLRSPKCSRYLVRRSTAGMAAAKYAVLSQAASAGEAPSEPCTAGRFAFTSYSPRPWLNPTTTDAPADETPWRRSYSGLGSVVVDMACLPEGIGASRHPQRVEPHGPGIDPVRVAPGHLVVELAGRGLPGDHLLRGAQVFGGFVEDARVVRAARVLVAGDHGDRLEGSYPFDGLQPFVDPAAEPAIGKVLVDVVVDDVAGDNQSNCR